ncbi:MAG: hypothetical protein V1804_01280 [Patescibacteria group bacterium]
MELKIEIFLASIAIISGWLIYRLSMIAEYKKIINALEALLNTAGEWFSSSYPKDLNKEAWFYPGEIVYKVDTSIVPDIVNSSLISAKLSSQLTYFIQLVERFNHLIDNFNSFKYSDTKILLKSFDFYEKNLKNRNYIECENVIENKKTEIESEQKNTTIKNNDYERLNESLDIIKYIRYIYILKKMIHIDGIGTPEYFSNSKFPNLNKCYHEIKCLLKIEKLSKRGLFNDELRYILGDILFLIITAIIGLYSLLTIIKL